MSYVIFRYFCTAPIYLYIYLNICTCIYIYIHYVPLHVYKNTCKSVAVGARGSTQWKNDWISLTWFFNYKIAFVSSFNFKKTPESPGLSKVKSWPTAAWQKQKCPDGRSTPTSWPCLRFGQYAWGTSWWRKPSGCITTTPGFVRLCSIIINIGPFWFWLGFRGLPPYLSFSFFYHKGTLFHHDFLVPPDSVSRCGAFLLHFSLPPNSHGIERGSQFLRETVFVCSIVIPSEFLDVWIVAVWGIRRCCFHFSQEGDPVSSWFPDSFWFRPMWTKNCGSYSQGRVRAHQVQLRYVDAEDGLTSAVNDTVKILLGLMELHTETFANIMLNGDMFGGAAVETETTVFVTNIAPWNSKRNILRLAFSCCFESPCSFMRLSIAKKNKILLFLAIQANKNETHSARLTLSENEAMNDEPINQPPARPGPARAAQRSPPERNPHCLRWGSRDATLRGTKRLVAAAKEYAKKPTVPLEALNRAIMYTEGAFPEARLNRRNSCCKSSIRMSFWFLIGWNLLFNFNAGVLKPCRRVRRVNLLSLEFW